METLSKPMKPMKPKKSPMEVLLEGGLPCSHARFHQPVAPYIKEEPVSEFSVDLKVKTKYLVESIVYTDMGVICKVRDQTIIVPLANVIFCRFK